MPMKGRGTSQLQEVDRWDHGVGWLAHPDETMQRASHIVEVNGDVWVFDPVDAPGVDDLFAEFGDVAGVAIGLDRHKRDAAAIANRHEVPVYVASWMTGVADELDANVERFGNTLADSGFQTFRIVDRSVPPWQEVGFYHEELRTLFVPETVGTVDYFCAPGERLGVHPMLRPFPPRRALYGYDPDRLLVGHGAGISENAGDELRTALSNARRNLPNAYIQVVKSMLSN
ncbi:MULTISPECIES: MBL fold metallo-hydrolase [Haloferax]|nr:hypothetical protein [Haloferax mediterranei]AFK19282.2 hypothetical protein HFX_1575 [Haloferax mediterranei ATCC 33500]AHZ21360.1 hypothetical protein BM92_01235 [Haloferax mediterranei ATCC 33500]MDX5989385.1 hypothetical protein [Haloferax mediterranei ATCC 33500]